MTIEQAVEILNRRQHLKANPDDPWDDPWRIAHRSDDPHRAFIKTDDPCEALSFFEAIAIAEKYAREERPARGGADRRDPQRADLPEGRMTDDRPKLTGRDCICGHRWDLFEETNEDCERCLLVRLIAGLAMSTFGYYSMRMGDETAARTMAEDFNMRIEDIRAFCMLEDPDA